MGSIVPVPTAPVQVESRQVYVCKPVVEVVAGQGRAGLGKGCVSVMWNSDERGHTGSGPFLPDCGQDVAPVDEREWVLLVNWRTGRRVAQVGIEVR